VRALDAEEVQVIQGEFYNITDTLSGQHTDALRQDLVRIRGDIAQAGIRSALPGIEQALTEM
jgi:hypothetical protein